MGQSNSHQANKLKMKALSALVFSAWALPVVALDLGRLQILSAIGEPLRAEIEIAQASPDELKTLRAQLASPEVFGQAGMEFSPALNGVAVDVQTRSNGAAFLVLNGRVPVQDNFLDVILEAQSSTGRHVKNYALLLNSVSDKAGTAQRAVTPTVRAPEATLPISDRPLAQRVQAMPVSRPNETAQLTASGTPLNASRVELNAEQVPVYRFDPVDKAPAAPAASANLENLRAPAVQARPSETITVKTGDTASRLALRHMRAGVSLDQMMLAMLKANPGAFIQGNVNLVKAGAVLRMPNAEEAAQIPPAEARKTVVAQARDFAEYARRLAQSPLLVDSKNSRAMAGKVTREATKPETESPQQDKLTLSQPSIAADASEAKLAAERESQDAAQQLAALNKNLKDLEALSASPSSATPSTETTAAAVPDLAPAAPAAVSAAVATPSADSPPAESPSSSLQSLIADKHLWPWAGGLLALLLLAAFWIRKQSKAPESIYAPSYDDFPSDEIEPVVQKGAGAGEIPAQMSSIDLNLQPHAASAAISEPQPQAQPLPSQEGVTSTSNNAEDTEQSKLNLAAQLLAKGDKDLARALILSVVSSSQGDLKARAVQLLGQIR